MFENRNNFNSAGFELDIPEGLKLVKFHKRHAVVPEELPGEEIVQGAFTRRQLGALAYVGRSTIGSSLRISEERLSCVALNTANPNLRHRIGNFRRAFEIAVANGEQYLASGIIREALILQEFTP